MTLRVLFKFFIYNSIVELKRVEKHYAVIGSRSFFCKEQIKNYKNTNKNVYSVFGAPYTWVWYTEKLKE